MLFFSLSVTTTMLHFVLVFNVICITKKLVVSSKMSSVFLGALHMLAVAAVKVHFSNQMFHHSL